MAVQSVDRDLVVQRSTLLRSFPTVVLEIMNTLDDPDANLNVLVNCIRHDPVIAARVLSVANAAATRGRRDAEVSSIYTATSLIGLRKVRSIALISALGRFIHGSATAGGLPAAYWEHSVSISVCAEELAGHVDVAIHPDQALVAGLLHDIGQLWLLGWDGQTTQRCWQQASAGPQGIETLEQEAFGVDHGVIGAWLAEHWGLSEAIVQAIAHHHRPTQDMPGALAPLIHVAEVLGNALDLAQRGRNRVTWLDAAACERLNLVWDERIRPVMGRIEARSRHANAFFDQNPALAN